VGIVDIYSGALQIPCGPVNLPGMDLQNELVTVIVQPVLTFFKTLTEPEPKKKEGSLLSSKEAAEYLGVSTTTIQRMCRNKLISFLKVTPHEYRFNPADLELFKRSRTNRSRTVGHW
jgi:excisionase family DNA binding protein